MNRFIMRRMTGLDSRARELEAQGAHGQALKVREELCELTQKHLAEGHPWLIDRLLDLATSYRQTKELAKAEKAYLDVIQRLEQQHDPAQPDLAQILNTLGVFYCELEQHQQAVDLFRRALTLFESLPTNNPQLATLHNNLASSHHSLGHADQAREHYHEALRIFHHHPISPERAHCLCDLAELLAEEEDESSTELIAEALRTFRQLYPADSLLLAEAKMHIADLYCRMADTRSAMTVLEEAAGTLKLSSQHEGELAQCLDLMSRLQMTSPRSGNYRSR